ncbi:MAG: SagB/ThcOx family dehydrogenase [Treponema sp.]|nr:SagB/ThcOx family dehydrogenase [Treponema sp.]
MSQIEQNRRFMQCPAFGEAMSQSDQSKGIPAPPFGKTPGANVITLPSFAGALRMPLYEDLLDARRSKRKFIDKPMTQAQLAFMLWSTQGIQNTVGDVATRRPVPSGGSRHPFETYFAVKSVEGLDPGLYHYLPDLNRGEKICSIERLADLPDDETISQMVVGQKWVTSAQVVFFYSCIPYKAEWRYAEHAHRVVLIDLGHLGQNAMLSAAALELGSCCIAAYDQKLCDKIFALDGIDEYTVYVIAVGYPAD